MFKQLPLIFFFLAILGVIPARSQIVLENEYKTIVNLLPERSDEADSLAKAYLLKVSTLPPPSDTLITNAYYLLGMVQYYRNQYVLAEKYYRAALETPNAKKNDRIRENCLNNLGIVYVKQNRFNEALDALMGSLKIAENREDSFAMVQTWINVSLLEYKKSNISKALQLGYRTLDYSIRHNDSLNQAIGHHNIAFIQAAAKDYDKVFYHGYQSLGLYKSLQHDLGVAGVLPVLAAGHRSNGNIQMAEVLLEEAKELCEKTGNQYELAYTFMEMGYTNLEKGSNPKKTLGYFREAERIAKSIGTEDLFTEIYLGITGLHARTGNYKAYKEASKRFMDDYMENYRRESASAYEQLRVFYELDNLLTAKQELERDIQQRNRQLLITFLLLGFLLIAAIGITLLYFRLKRYTNTLFRLNLAEAQKDNFFPSSESLPATPTPSEADNESLPILERYKELIMLINNEKLYLDPELSIQSLASKMATNQKYVSQAINEFSGTNFFGLMRRLRVTEARKLIVASKGKGNLQDIATRSGFSNSSTFSRQFRDATGFSPSEFQEMVARSPDFSDFPPNDLGFAIEKA